MLDSPDHIEKNNLNFTLFTKPCLGYLCFLFNHHTANLTL